MYGRVWGVRRRTASRCSRALPLVEDEDDGDEGLEEALAVAAIAMVSRKDGERKGRGQEAREREGGLVVVLVMDCPMK